MPIPPKQKLHSLAILLVAASFQWFFMFSKHDPALRSIIPFGDDPYDALGSFATIVNILLCLLLLWRTFRPSHGRAPSAAQSQYLRRTQAAIPLSIHVTLAADAIAMARHPHLWLATPGQNKLLAAFAGTAALAATALWLVRSPAPAFAAQPTKRRAPLPWLVAAIFVAILAVYPEQWINRLLLHLLTVLIGDLLLFAPVAIFLFYLFPDPEAQAAAQQKSRSKALYLWIGATLLGLGFGAWIFVMEMTEGGAALPPLRMRVIVASVYVGLTLAGMLIALAFLRRPLGLGQGSFPTARAEVLHQPSH